MRICVRLRWEDRGKMEGAGRAMRGAICQTVTLEKTGVGGGVAADRLLAF
jgi:hypothetical protein